jgi:signal peptidase I
VSQRPALGCLFEVVETLVLTVVIFLGIQTFVAQPYKVQQESMETTLLPDQYVLVDKLSPRWAAYGYGDIVVFDPPESWSAGSGVPFIKRIIGLPGERVLIRSGVVYINGHRLEEPYLPEEWVTSNNWPLDNPNGEVMPPNQYFVMGDNRDNSQDSRYWGFLPREYIKGKALIIYWSYEAEREDYQEGDTIRGLGSVFVHFFSRTRWDRMFHQIR